MSILCFYLVLQNPQYPLQHFGLNLTAGSSSSAANIAQQPFQNQYFDPTAGSSSSVANIAQYLPQNWGFDPTAGSLLYGGNVNPTTDEFYYGQNPSGNDE